jgi:hypothetical protein
VVGGVGVDVDWVYVGELRVRASRAGLAYIHIPPRIARPLRAKRVTVKATVKLLEGCDKKYSLPPINLVFNATLTYIGGTYRVTLPAKAVKPLKGMLECLALDVFIAPEATTSGGPAPSQEGA